MTIEADLAAIAKNTGRIADSLEAIASHQGIVADAPGEPDSKPAASKKKTTTKKKASKKKASKKKASSKKTTVGKTKEADDSGLTLTDDVRPVAKRLRAEVSPAALKSTLKKYGASTLQQLNAAKYQQFIDDALGQLDADEADNDDDDLSDFDEDEVEDELDLDDDDDL